MLNNEVKKPVKSIYLNFKKGKLIMAIKGNTDVIRRNFYTGSAGDPTYYDPDDNEITIKIMAPDYSVIETIDSGNISRADTGKYDITITWANNYPYVYLVLEYAKDGVEKVRRYKVTLDYYDSAQPFTEDSDGNFT